MLTYSIAEIKTKVEKEQNLIRAYGCCLLWQQDILDF